MNNNIEKFYPDIVITPGDIILEHMEANNMNQKELALRIDIRKEHLSKIINGYKAITVETASALEKVFDMPTSFWLNLEINYQENLKIKALLSSDNAELEILNKIPYSEICKKGWLEKKTDKIDIIDQLRKFFRVSNLVNISSVFTGAFRLQDRKKGDEYAQATWVAYGENIATGMDVESFDKKSY